MCWAVVVSVFWAVGSGRIRFIALNTASKALWLGIMHKNVFLVSSIVLQGEENSFMLKFTVLWVEESIADSMSPLAAGVGGRFMTVFWTCTWEFFSGKSQL